ITALQRRERAEQIQAPADRAESVPVMRDLARTARGERIVDPTKTLSVRLDAPAQAARRHPFSESSDAFHSAAPDAVGLLSPRPRRGRGAGCRARPVPGRGPAPRSRGPSDAAAGGS